MSETASWYIDENLVVEEDDWIDVLQGPFRSEFLATVVALDLKRIKRYPPRKEGLPLGHELRVLRQFCTGGNALFDPSAFSNLYRRLASRREQDLYRAFVLGESLPAVTWCDLIGKKALGDWRERRLLREAPEGLWVRFRVFTIGAVLLIGDRERPKLLRRVMIGQDSLTMARFMEGRRLSRVRRYLDVGPGSGVILLSVCPFVDEAMGWDINPRAVAISRLNADLNEIGNCSVHLRDALAVDDRAEPFDLITWNSPFVFMPEEAKDKSLEAYGGYMGLEVILAFLQVMPRIMLPGATAYLGAASPVLRSGENVLEDRLRSVAPGLALDFVVHVIQAHWNNMYRRFHESHDIRKFETVFLEVTRGAGKVHRVEPPWTVRGTDVAREIVHRLGN